MLNHSSGAFHESKNISRSKTKLAPFRFRCLLCFLPPQLLTAAARIPQCDSGRNQNSPGREVWTKSIDAKSRAAAAWYVPCLFVAVRQRYLRKGRSTKDKSEPNVMVQSRSCCPGASGVGPALVRYGTTTTTTTMKTMNCGQKKEKLTETPWDSAATTGKPVYSVGLVSSVVCGPTECAWRWLNMRAGLGDRSRSQISGDGLRFRRLGLDSGIGLMSCAC